MIENPYMDQEPYRGQIHIKLMLQLSMRYAQCLRALGPQTFRHYAKLTLEKERPHTGNLLDYGMSFLEVLQDTEAPLWLMDLARLDWALGYQPLARQSWPDSPAWLDGMSILNSCYDLISTEHIPLRRLNAIHHFWCIPWHPEPICQIPTQDIPWLLRLDGSRSMRRLLTKNKSNTRRQWCIRLMEANQLIR